MTGLTIGAAGAAAAYRVAGALPAVATGAAGGAPAAGAGGFGDVLRRAVEGVVETGRASDVAATQALSGQGSVTDLVTAVGRAELALQTAVAVRDRMVSAYQDVMRMPI